VSGPDLEIRPFEAGRDESAVLGLLAGTLGWLPDGHHAAFFQWKHRANPFGPSPAWVASLEGTIIGFRTFLRWELASGHQVVRAVRAVDTATSPGHQGRGVFSRLTLHGVEALRAEGTAFVFNTPNDRSRPGYLKMGWHALGRVPLAARPGGPAGLARMVRARVPAEMWSKPSGAGVPAAEALADEGAVERLLASQPATGLATNRSAHYLRWRYAGFEPLGYRALLAGGRAEDGLALFRLRRRGPATEATVVEVLVPDGDVRLAARLAGRVVQASGADYAVASLARPALRAGFVPLPRVGPIVTWRALAEPGRPDLASWRLVLGDLELL
jgi:hypothetical protein